MWQEIDLNQISNIASGDHSVTFSELTMEPSYWPLVWLKYDGNNLNTTDVLVEMGINTGCQVSKMQILFNSFVCMTMIIRIIVCRVDRFILLLLFICTVHARIYRMAGMQYIINEH